MRGGVPWACFCGVLGLITVAFLTVVRIGVPSGCLSGIWCLIMVALADRYERLSALCVLKHSALTGVFSADTRETQTHLQARLRHIALIGVKENDTREKVTDGEIAGQI